MIGAHQNQQSTHPWDEVLVLREYPLREGYSLASSSRFADDVWQLQPALHQRHVQKLILDFTTLPSRYQTLAKELNCAFMAMPLPPGERRPSLRSIRSYFSALKHVFHWLDQHRGGPSLGELTGADIKAYSHFLREMKTSDQSQLRRLQALRRIWRFRSTLPGDHLKFDPQDAPGWYRNTRSRTENSTERIPEQVLGPLIVWATRYVDLFSRDIIETTREWDQLNRSASLKNPKGQRKRPDLLPALENLLDRHVQEGRPLPGHHGKINYSFLGKVLGSYRAILYKNPVYRDRIQVAVDIVGIGETSDYYTPVTAELDGETWISKISTDYGYDSLPTLARHLQTACYVLIAFYSGMRDSEIKHLQPGCLRVERDLNGVPYRWKLKSRAFKGESDMLGAPATWTVGEPVWRAIAVLEKIQPRGSEYLFQSLPYGSGWKRSYVGRVLTSNASREGLNSFVEWVNTYCDQRQRQDAIGQVDGRPYRLKLIQFRRTLAWFIARRPGGAIAGALAYRHLSIQMFEGYAGTSDSGFRAEVESEQALARGENLIHLSDTHRQHLHGPGAEEAIRRLEELCLNTDGFQGSVLTDQRRLLRLMKRHDPAIYPGTYVTCVYRHDKALCRPRNDSSGRVLPELADCKPLKCKNVVLTEENIAAWQAESDKIDEHLVRRPRLPPVLEQRLRQRQEQIHGILTRHVEQEPK